MEVKVTWDEIEVKENIDKTLAKILMLKGEKGDTGTTDYNELLNKPTSLTDFGGVLPIDQGGTGATNAKDAITNLGGVPIYTGVTGFISLPATTAEIIQAMPYPSILMTWVDTVSNSITDLPCSYGTLTIHKRSGTRLQILYNRSYEGAVNGNNFYFGNYNTLSKTVTWNKIFTSYSGCQVPIENGGTGASNVSVARTNLDVYSKSEILDVIYPVGAIYMSVNSANPQTLFGGSWEQIQDRFLLAAGSAYSAGSTGGKSTHTHTTGDHTLTIDEIPSHTHGYRDANDDSSTDIWCYINSNRKGSINYVEPTGGGQPHNHGNTDEASNLPPYLSVYVWKRIA